MVRRMAQWSWVARTLLVGLVMLLPMALRASGTVWAAPPSRPQAQGSTPTMLSYQGTIEVRGAAYSGVGYFKFAIVDSATGNGTGNYWSNDGAASGQPSAAVPLAVSDGLFNVLLGDTSLTGMLESIDEKVFAHDPTYLRVWFSQSGLAGSFEPLEPNQRMVSVAYALRAQYAESAGTVDGYHASGTPVAGSLIALDGAAELRVPRVRDSDDTNYYLDPAGASVVSALDVRLELRNQSATYIDVAEDLRAYSFVDRQNTNYYVDPAGYSRVSTVRADRFGVNATRTGAGYYVSDTESNDIDEGLYVGTADEYGVYVGSAQYGVRVDSASTSGVSAAGTTQGGWFEDSTTDTYVRVAYGSYGIYSNGVIRGSSITSAQLHPTDSTKMIVYGVLEGGETGTYYRGTAQLRQGTVAVELPEHFSLVTQEEGLTVQVTPRDDCKGLYVAEVTTRQIVVKELQGGTSNARFDFFINGVRAGYRDLQVLSDVSGLTLDEAGQPIQGRTDD